MVLILLKHAQPNDPKLEYSKAQQLFLRGRLEECQLSAKQGCAQFAADKKWAAKFRVLEAQAMIWRGMSEKGLALLEDESSAPNSPQDKIEKLALEATAYTHLHRFSQAEQQLAQAEALCAASLAENCGEIYRARGVLAVERGEFSSARRYFLDGLSFARKHHDRLLESNSYVNLGTVSLQESHYDEALDWSKAAYEAAGQLGNENRAQIALGNSGWAYLQLGDADRALTLLVDAERRAATLGNVAFEIKWLTAAANVYQQRGEFDSAIESLTHALALARQIDSKEDIVDSLEDLAHTSVDAGKLDEASGYVHELDSLVHASGNRLDFLDVRFAEARITAARRQDREAEFLFRIVEKDPASQTSMRMGAEHELAALYESEGQLVAADRMYRTALTTFESARNELKKEESKLPFLVNATAIYDGYIHFLVAQGKSEEALLVVDQSRAQTLAQGLGITGSSKPGEVPALRPEMIAQKTNATLLFYWLGENQSYLWAITPHKTTLFPLPAHHDLVPTIERYRKTLLGLTDPVERADVDGLALYRMLVAPASSLIPPGGNVVILCDGELSQLNFETLIVPGPPAHYLIEVANLISAPSLHLLAASHTAETPNRKLLLFGDAISPNPDYPELPMAAAEMKQIEQHFASQDQAVYAREKATAPAYLDASPQRFAYIHFVAHGVASRTDPLDSAIILSRANVAEDAFKLHAREILQHPLHARLVTIAACYGSGSRSYAGEGLVGLAWAFLRAGAHNVIGALWEASDESTVRLMSDLYLGIEQGAPPAAALRAAKLNLLHSQREFRKPFYWAPFQIYSGL